VLLQRLRKSLVNRLEAPLRCGARRQCYGGGARLGCSDNSLHGVTARSAAA
jgi:hypothetical protein